MEKIYKIKVRNQFDPRWLYPSERRYSASTVLGLGVIHLALASATFLLACLTLNYGESFSLRTIFCNSVMVTFAPCIVCLGALAAGLTALVTWKKWYIDHSITLFFLISIVSVITSSISLTIITILLTTNATTDKFVIIINILTSSVLEWLWSCISIKVAYVGMRNAYPDDITLKQEATIVNIKNKESLTIPPDIINCLSPEVNHILAKYLMISSSKNNVLPKDESHSEYKARVNKFLCSSVSKQEV